MDSEAKLNLWSLVVMAFAIFYLLLHLFWASPLYGQELTGQQMMDKIWENYRGIKYEKEIIWMFIISNPLSRWYTVQDVEKLKERRWGIKKMIRYLKYDSKREDKMYIAFDYPPKDAKAQFLIWRYPDRSDDVWMYHPALTDRRPKRLSATDQEDPFMGSSFTYEDIRRLMGEILDPFSCLLKEKSMDHYSIEVTPITNIDTGYSKRIFAVQDSDYFSEVKYYKNGQLVKIQKNSEIYFEKGVWRPAMVEMRMMEDDGQWGDTAVLYWPKKERELAVKIDDFIFTVDYMIRQGR